MRRNQVFLATVLVFALPGGLLAQGTIDGIQVQPDPACRNQEVVARVNGTGTCAEVSLQFDSPSSPAQTVVNPTFPVVFNHTYPTAGTYTLRAGSSDPQCVGEAQRTLQVGACLTLGVWEDLPLVSLRPEITGGFGLVQPGNPFPIVVFGEKFGTGGSIVLEGQFGSVTLQPLEWGSDGKFASGYVPGGICGVTDHQATIRIVSNTGWSSDPWPVAFTAAREVQVFPRSEVDVVSCGHDSNKDCCNGECDDSDIGWFSACGSQSSSICGSHYNAWAAIGNDAGTDHYRVDLSAGFWVVEGWDISVNVDPGEGWAQLRQTNAYQEKVGDFVVDWEVTPNDDVFYDLFVHISGPCGTSFETAFARSMLTGPMQAMEGFAGAGDIDARALERMRSAERRLRAEQIRAAEAEDRTVQRQLTGLRAAVTDEAIAAARELEEARAEATAFRRLAVDADEGDEAVAAAATRLRQRLQRIDSPPGDPE